MKNSKEIASAVFQARDEYMEQQQTKNRRIKKAAAISGTACALCLTVVGAGYWNSVQERLPVVDVNTDSIQNEIAHPVIEENDGDITNIIPSTFTDDSKEETNANASDSIIDEIPEAEVIAHETPQINEETENSNANDNPVIITPDEAIQHTTENNTVSSDNTASSSNSEENDICHFMKGVIVDGIAYLEFDAGTATYTPDICLGSPSNYDGNYRAFFSHIPAKLYTTKEDSEVLIVEEENGEVVTLIKVRE